MLYISKLSNTASNLSDYLAKLNAATLEKLYADSGVCLAVLGNLPEMAKQFVMRLLFVDQSIPQAVIQSWATDSDEAKRAFEALSALKIWAESPMPGGLPGWKLNDRFKDSLKVALLGGGNPWVFHKTHLEKDKHGRDVSYLDEYARERWDCILHYMTGSGAGSDDTESQDSKSANFQVTIDTIRTLEHAGLIRFEADDRTTAPIITSDGFQFLLMDTNSQVWYFLVQYLDMAEERSLNLVECITFLFQLSFLTLGRDYPTADLSESLQLFLQHLREFGLVYQRKRSAGRFYPTRLAINLASGLKQGATLSTIQGTGYIIVETNYRVYAYTDSNMQIALISLFTEMQYRFPNLVIGLITRDSVRQALKSGITADQIINFLKMNAHPQSRKDGHLIPPTVEDQIRLWEIERDRFKLKEGYQYSQFLSQGDFELLRNYAKDLGVLVYENPSRRIMIVDQSGHDDVRRFWKRHKKEH